MISLNEEVLAFGTNRDVTAFGFSTVRHQKGCWTPPTLGYLASWTSKSRTSSFVSSVPFLDPTAQTSFVAFALILQTTPPEPPDSKATCKSIDKIKIRDLDSSLIWLLFLIMWWTFFETARSQAKTVSSFKLDYSAKLNLSISPIRMVSLFFGVLLRISNIKTFKVRTTMEF